MTFLKELVYSVRTLYPKLIAHYTSLLRRSLTWKKAKPNQPKSSACMFATDFIWAGEKTTLDTARESRAACSARKQLFPMDDYEPVGEVEEEPVVRTEKRTRVLRSPRIIRRSSLR